MFRIKLDYSFTYDGSGAAPHLDNALFTLLRAIRESGSISQSAKMLGLSYRHVWGELKRWESALGQTLIEWVKGRRARLSPFGEKLLWAEERARARISPQVQSLAAEMERAFALAFDQHTHVLPVCASHDLALPLLRDGLAAQGVHLDLRYATASMHWPHSRPVAPCSPGFMSTTITRPARSLRAPSNARSRPAPTS